MTRTLHNYLTMRMHAGAADNVKRLLNRKMRVSQKLRKRDSGFTLMEMMIVIAVHCHNSRNCYPYLHEAFTWDAAERIRKGYTCDYESGQNAGRCKKFYWEY